MFFRGNPDFFHKFYRIFFFVLFEYRAIVANRREGAKSSHATED